MTPNFDRATRPPPTTNVEIAVPNMAKRMIEPMFWKKLPCNKIIITHKRYLIKYTEANQKIIYAEPQITRTSSLWQYNINNIGKKNYRITGLMEEH